MCSFQDIAAAFLVSLILINLHKYEKVHYEHQTHQHIGCISTWLKQLHYYHPSVTLVVKPSTLFFHFCRYEF